MRDPSGNLDLCLYFRRPRTGLKDGVEHERVIWQTRARCELTKNPEEDREEDVENELLFIASLSLVLI